MAGFKESPSQTAGPYVHIGCVPNSAGLERRALGAQLGAEMVSHGAEGQRIQLEIAVFDGAEEPVRDALIEIWQAGPNGRYEGCPGFSHWGRQGADLNTGLVCFETLKPGASADQAPHILIWIVARGINLGLTTRVYFPDEDNSQDYVMQQAGERARTLLAEKTARGYRHRVRLQGPEETVFFDV